MDLDYQSLKPYSCFRHHTSKDWVFRLNRIDITSTFDNSVDFGFAFELFYGIIFGLEFDGVLLLCGWFVGNIDFRVWGRADSMNDAILISEDKLQFLHIINDGKYSL